MAASHAQCNEEEHVKLPTVHRYITGIFTLLDKDKQTMHSQSFETKRSSTVSLHFGISNVAGMAEQSIFI